MTSTCFGHLHVHLQECLYVVSLPHVVLCHKCWGCGPAELVCNLVHCLSVSLYFILYCILTCSMEQSPSWETNWFPSSQEIPPFHGTQNFITAFTSACHLSLSSAHTSGSIQVWDSSLYFITWRFYGEEYLNKPLSWGTTPCRQSATAYSIYSQAHPILEAVPPSATWGRAMPL